MEQSGRLGDMLGQATNYIDKQLDTIIDIMTKMIEPIMLVVIGTIVLIPCCCTISAIVRILHGYVVLAGRCGMSPNRLVRC